MQTMIPLKQWDVVIAIFPFTDLRSAKRRPALIVGADANGPDLLLAFISSRIHPAPTAADLLILPTASDFSTTGLKVASMIRLDKLVTLNRSLIRRRIGHLNPTLQKQVKEKLIAVFGIDPREFQP